MNYVKSIALTLLFGKPFLAYFGVITLLCLLFTASIAILTHKGIRKIPFKWHPIMARITIGLAITHAVLALSVYF